MAKNKRKNSKAAHKIARNWTAVAAFQRGGAGKHGDKRSKRRRTRGAAKRAAIREHC